MREFVTLNDDVRREAIGIRVDMNYLPLPSEEEIAMKPRFEQGPLNIYAGAGLSREQIDLARGTYYGMVSLVDVQVGRMVEALKELGLLDDTIIAFSSDQGFQLGDHGLWKKRVFYEGNVRVPFILRYPPRMPDKRQRRGFVSSDC